MQQNIHQIYSGTLKKYRKYRSRYQSGVKTGRFYQYSKKKQSQIIIRLSQLAKRLRYLKTQLKLAIAAGTLSLCLAGSPAQGQQLGPFVQNNEANPFYRPPLTGTHKKLTFADIDNDGDFDAAIGIQGGGIQFFENVGSATSPRFIERTSTDNPFSSIVAGSGYAAPQLVDFDEDGDFDLILAERDYISDVRYFENTDFDDDGVIGNTPSFTEITGVSSPISGVSGGNQHVKPTLADLDGDADLDILLGHNAQFPSYSGPFSFFRNQAGSFVSETIPTGLAGEFSTNDKVAPTFYDYDGDGDYDVFITRAYSSQVRFFENTDIEGADQTLDNIEFAERTGADNPFDGISVANVSVLSFVDIDLDGDNDAFLGTNYANEIRFFENDGAGSFVEQTGFDNPFELFDLGNKVFPTFADIDGDSDMDAVIGEENSVSLFYFQNAGNGSVEQITGPANPFDNIITLAFFNSPDPEFIDIDDDGDLDLFVGLYDGTSGPGRGVVNFYSNNGSNIFTAQTSPITDNSYYNSFSPSFADLDADGDFDVAIGYSNSYIRYNQNQGSPTSPNFVLQTGASDPFYGIQVGAPSYTGLELKPVFTDIDHDGDLDVATGVHYFTTATINGTVQFLENQGASNFALRSGTSNPFDGISVGNNSHPAFTDWDEDGDLDLFIGDGYGQITYFENQNIAPQINSSVSTITFNEGSSALTLDNTMTIADDGGNNTVDQIDRDMMIGLEVSIITNLIPSEDVLSFTPSANVSGSYNSTTGILTLTGVAAASEYEQVLQSVTYFNSNNVDPSPLTRTIQIIPTDYDATNTAGITIDVNISINNSAPDITLSSPTTITYTENASPVILDAGLQVSDVDNVNLESALVRISVNLVNTEDVLAVTDPNGLTVGYNSATGELTLNGTASVANYQAALRSITYQNTSEDPNDLTRTVEFTVSDGTDSSTPVSLDVNVSPINDQPVVSTSAGTTIFTEGDAPEVVDGAITVNDVDDTQLVGATISIINNFQTNVDILGFTSQGGIGGGYDASTGVLTLSGPSSVANYEAVLRTISFSNGSDRPTDAIRTIEFIVNDGIADSSPATKDLDVVPVNDIPQLTSDNNTALDYTQNAAPVTVDDLIGIIDFDDDNMESAMVTITGFVSGDDLLFTDQNNITGSFTSGVLILNGSDSKANYETALRSVQFESSNGQGSRTIDFVVFDGTDNSAPRSRTINITDEVVNQPPAVNTSPQSTQLGSVLTFNWCDIIDDPDNADNELTITVLSTLSGATTSVDGCDIVVDYTNSTFTGNDEIVLEACDPSGACDTNTVNVDVINEIDPPPTPPVNIFNAVSPNNDGLNDFWEVVGLTSPNSIELFNRWGDSVESFADVEVNAELDLSDLPAGTYFYKINSPEGEFKGYIVIKK